MKAKDFRNMRPGELFQAAIKDVLGLKINRKTSVEGINTLQSIAEAGKRFTIKQIVKILFNPQNDDERYMARLLVKKWVKALKKRYAKQGIWFGSINDKHQYGFIRNVEEEKYVKQKVLKTQHGVIKSSLRVLENLKKFLKELKVN